MHLKVLSVSRNRITHLPKYIAHMQQLKVFKLEHNPFQWPPEDRLECTDEAQHPQWLEQLKQWILANDPPIVPVHPAIARIRESSESSIDSKPPDTVQQYLIEHANKPPHSPLVLASHHMIHACKKLDLISNLISQLTSEGHLNLEKETKHIQRELQQMVLVLVKRDSPHLVLKALVKHLHAFMKSLDLVLPKSIDNPAFDLHLNLEWHQCNRHISQAISCLSADSQELSNALQNIKRECDKRGLAKGVQLVTDMEKQPKTEDLITLLTFLKDRRLLALGLELTKAAKKLL
ncbi:hypothetical protein EDD86DRAFT_208348 [Gorgonomyces haynaldii]|nr:hypothetical protein EDD86DRAFT_208348 [Gorgonomyces haynaldii]